MNWDKEIQLVRWVIIQDEGNQESRSLANLISELESITNEAREALHRVEQQEEEDDVG